MAQQKTKEKEQENGQLQTEAEFVETEKESRYIKQITLDNGSVVGILREPDGKDQRIAAQESGFVKNEDVFLFQYALVARVIEIDGKPVAADELDDMGLRDVNRLISEALPSGK